MVAIVLLTGLPAAGKTTIATIASFKLNEIGVKNAVLDGEWVRRHVNEGIGFSREERRRHLIRATKIATLMVKSGILVLMSFIAPYRDVRKEMKELVTSEGIKFMEVYVKVSINEAIRRDPKGLYKKALTGEIKNFTGIDDPYEEPENPDLIIDTEKTAPNEAASVLVNTILERIGPPIYFELPIGLYNRIAKLAEKNKMNARSYLLKIIEEAVSIKEDEESIIEKLRQLGYA
ncbi:MAG: adenylyl-sulfate kinase [Thermoproteus sp.]|nr:adenylyl-sulfate kinase [Thermoproteus sp.]